MKKTSRHNHSQVVILIEEYLSNLKTLKYSPRSIDLYRRSLLDFEAWLEKAGIKKPQNVTEDHINRYRLSIIDRGFKIASIQVYMRSVKIFFTYLEKNHHVFVNPSARIEPCKGRRQIIQAPTEEEVRIMLNAPDVSAPTGIRDRAVLETSYSTGLRRQEMMNISVRDIDLDNETIRVMGKGNRERVVPLTSSAVHWLQKYLQEARPVLMTEKETDAVWVRTPGVQISNPLYDLIFRKYRKQPGIKTHISPHSLRRACATHMIRNGAHPVQVQMLLGHSSMRHLSQYLSLTFAELEKIHSESKPGS